jgi:hypothetical protein
MGYMNELKIHISANDKEALCKNKAAKTFHKLMDGNPKDYCKQCRRIACGDCRGSGVLGGGCVGILCNCIYGVVRALERRDY